MAINRFHLGIMSVVLSVILIVLPLTPTAHDIIVENVFNEATFDFSGYRPDPRADDLYSVYHIIPSNPYNKNYHESVYSLGKVLSEYKGSIPGSSGYYLSRSKYHPRAVRLTLFTRNQGTSQNIDRWIHGMEQENLITIVPYVSKKLEQGIFTKNYGGDETMFRKYLSLYTPIGIECMGYDFKGAQKIWANLMEHGGTDITFLEHSSYFMKLSYDEKCSFIDSMYNKKWGHMVINFVLGYDDNK